MSEVYKPAEYVKLEYSEDPDDMDPTWVDVNFIDPSECEITVTPVRQVVNQNKQVTAKKEVEIDLALFDRGSFSSLLTIEQAFTEIAWRFTRVDGSSVETELAPISIGEEFTDEDGLEGFQILSNYHVGYADDAVTQNSAE